MSDTVKVNFTIQVEVDPSKYRGEYRDVPGHSNDHRAIAQDLAALCRDTIKDATSPPNTWSRNGAGVEDVRIVGVEEVVDV